MKRSILLAIGVLVALVGTVVLGTTYLVAERIDREGTDESILRLASQVVRELKSGETNTVEALARVDLATSVLPFVIVFDATDAPVAGTGYLDGELGTIPSHVLESARASGTHHAAWQPEPGLRFTTVEMAVGPWVILAGQSLKPSEARTEQVGTLVLSAWLSVIIAATAGVMLTWILAPVRQRQRRLQ